MYDENIMNIIYEGIGIERERESYTVLDEDQALNEFNIGSTKINIEITKKINKISDNIKSFLNKDNKEGINKNNLQKVLKIVDDMEKEVKSVKEEEKGNIPKTIIRYAIRIVTIVGGFALIEELWFIPIIVMIIPAIIDSINGALKFIRRESDKNNLVTDISKFQRELERLRNKKGIKDSDYEKINKCLDKLDDSKKRLERSSIIDKLDDGAKYAEKKVNSINQESYDPWSGLEESYDPWEGLY